MSEKSELRVLRAQVATDGELIKITHAMICRLERENAALRKSNQLLKDNLNAITAGCPRPCREVAEQTLLDAASLMEGGAK